MSKAHFVSCPFAIADDTRRWRRRWRGGREQDPFDITDPLGVRELRPGFLPPPPLDAGSHGGCPSFRRVYYLFAVRSLGTRFCSCFRDNSVRRRDAFVCMCARAPLCNYIVRTRARWKRSLRTAVFFDHAHKQRDTRARTRFLFSFP